MFSYSSIYYTHRDIDPSFLTFFHVIISINNGATDFGFEPYGSQKPHAACCTIPGFFRIFPGALQKWVFVSRLVKYIEIDKNSIGMSWASG